MGTYEKKRRKQLRRQGPGKRTSGEGQAWEAEFAMIQREIDGNSNDPAPYLKAAELLVANRKVREAVTYVEDAMELAPETPGIRTFYEELTRAEE